MGKTVIIEDDLHIQLKEYCNKNKLKINEYINEILDIQIKFTLKEKSELPLILKNSKGEVTETIICSEISSEIKNNLPKSLTLIRNTKDGSGFIANYIQK